MTLPPWKPAVGPEGDQDRRAFTRWIHAALDRQDEEELAKGNNPFVIRYIENRRALMRMAGEYGQHIAFPGPKPKRGAPKKPADKLTDFDWAARDVPRIRALFVQHWGQRNRMVKPLAEEIAAERWELSPADTARLIDKFQRRS